jgi:Domain of unknown function (DUF303).
MYGTIFSNGMIERGGMMFGVLLEKCPMDWQIFQQKDGKAEISCEGRWIVPKDALQFEIISALPMIRVLKEATHEVVIPWKKMDHIENDDGGVITGKCKTSLVLPKGGLYLIETGLKTKSKTLDWLFRGDICRHIGIGDIYVIAGQSNASGYGKDSVMDSPCLGVHMRRNSGSWDIAAHPMNDATGAEEALVNREMGISGTTPYLTFAKRIHEEVGYPIGLLPTALGGSAIRRWQKDGDLYQNMIDKVKLVGKDVKGILWYQGCSDTNQIEDAQQYYQNFKAFVENTRETLGYQIPIFTFQLNRFIEGSFPHNWGKVREAQRQAQNTIDEVYVLPALQASMSDAIHNSSLANIRLGEMQARLCMAVLYGGAPYFAPNLIRAVKKTEREIILEFEKPYADSTFFFLTQKAELSGITVMEGEREIYPQKVFADEMDNNKVVVLMTEEVSKDAQISFAWGENPTYTPFVDEVTYLPPLSFYRIEISS